MAAYIICRINVHDEERYAQYKARTPGLIAKYGGRFLVRGGDVETLEGERCDERLVVIAFPSPDAARTFYHSPDYQEARAIREPAADGQFVLVDGV